MLKQPIGPAPTTSTVWPRPTRANSCALMQQAKGSASAATSIDNPSGSLATQLALIAFGGTTMYSAKPPSYA